MNEIMEHINYVDMIAVAVVLFWTLLGLKQGLSGQIVVFLSGLTVTACAILGYDPCKAWLIQHYQMPFELARLIALASVIVIPLLIILAVHSVAGHIVKVTFTTWVDRLGGALAGFISSSAFVVLVFVFLNVIPWERRPDAVGPDSFIGSHLIGIESRITKSIKDEIGTTRNVIQKARDERAGRRERWEQ
jgi:uncharacterized membrane protein required for colicin V production